MVFFKWREVNERLITITESLNHLQPLLMKKELKLRVTTDSDLKAGSLKDLFYIQRSDNNWVKENMSKNVGSVK